MTRLSADIAPKILEEAQRVSGYRTKREAINCALRESVARRRALRREIMCGERWFHDPSRTVSSVRGTFSCMEYASPGGRVAWV